MKRKDFHIYLTEQESAQVIRSLIELIVNDKFIWRLLFADLHGVNVVNGCARHFKFLFYSERQIIFDVHYKNSLMAQGKYTDVLIKITKAHKKHIAVRLHLNKTG